ncbi:MAG: LacI family DNA-binding transcriptional regulator [Bradyrhizobiaceae bacterium]|nr:LacI family DNA-binding transcriptional regulator [Bradyrhizobiaceae bacterium]
MITIRHIAERLDLSVSTVARALADHPRISRATKERVRAMADELGYIANAAARVMRGGSSRLIGLLVPDIRSTFYAMTAQVLSKCFERDGYHLALSITDDDPDSEFQQVRELLSARVAGIVIVPCAAPHRETVELVRRVQHVQLLRRIPALGDWFGMDDERAMLDATGHLIALGHRRIAYVGDVIFPTGKARYHGFCRAHADARKEHDGSLVELGSPDIRFGSDAVKRLLARRPAPTALITSSVLVTLGAAERIAASGIDVPGRLSFLGFGDGPWQKWWGPGLTTLRLPTEELATGCALWLLHRLKSARQPDRGRPHVAITPPSMVLRGSTAPPKPA